MKRRTLGVDLAKDCFQVSVSYGDGSIVERHRFNRAQFTEFMAQMPASRVLFEACGTAHHWARTASAWGHQVELLPAQHVRPYRRGNKNDRRDADALLEAGRCDDIEPVPVKTEAQQAVIQLHRLREQWKTTRTARINSLRGALREFGIDLPVGAVNAVRQAPGYLDALPGYLRVALQAVLQEIEALQLRLLAVERSLEEIAAEDAAVKRLRQVEGIGLLNATAMVATAGSAGYFPSGRQFAAWLGITPRESSSGFRRNLGRITKRGDVYLRTLLIHGARSVLARAKQLNRIDPARLSRLQKWGLQLQRRVGHNKAAVALANKLARICWAVWRTDTAYQPSYGA
jgi:transposase